MPEQFSKQTTTPPLSSMARTTLRAAPPEGEPVTRILRPLSNIPAPGVFCLNLIRDGVYFFCQCINFHLKSRAVNNVDDIQSKSRCRVQGHHILKAVKGRKNLVSVMYLAADGIFCDDSAEFRFQHLL